MIYLSDLRKSYRTGDFVQRALDGVSAKFRDSEFVAILGPSGSGKTTFLNVIGGLDHADSGDLIINGVSTKGYHAKDWDAYRNHHVGFVFQSYNLIPHQTILSNVELALTLAGISPAERKHCAQEALTQVGLGEHIHKKPSQLSGGQMQRVAIARALVNNPDIVLADEPTGALDTETGEQVMGLLAEVAKKRLVVMVTHNPELAEKYATRIMRIADGHIVDDTDPFEGAEQDVSHNVATATSSATINSPKSAATATKPHPGRASMSFLTALALSFSNLMAKKGRTLLTAFAGSIGIMGIAAILALSNGVSNYIDKVQEDALSSSPLTITKSSFDITSMMTKTTEYRTGSKKSANDTATDKKKSKDELIPSSPIMSDVLTDVKNNDLKSFRAFLESGKSGMEPHVSAITYGYGIKPQIYMADSSKGVKQLNPSSLSKIMSNGVSSMSAMSVGGSNMGFQEMVDDQDLLNAQFDVVAGKWPKKYNETVLVLNKSGELSDYTLYSIGVLDPDKLSDMLSDAIASKKVTAPATDVKFSYDDALKLKFKLVNQVNLFARSEDGKTWTDHSNDKDFLKSAVDAGTELRIVGVVKPKATASNTSLNEGVAYRHDLILHLIKEAGESEIVQEQLAHPETDVFTGKTFDALKKEQGKKLDMSSLFSVDQSLLASAFTLDQSKLNAGKIDPSAFDFSKLKFDTSSLKLQIDQAAIAKSVRQSLANNLPTPDTADLGFGDLADISGAPDEATAARLANMQAVSQAVGENFPKLLQGYIASLGKKIQAGDDVSNYSQLMTDYLATPVSQGGGKDYFDAIVAAAGDETQQQKTSAALTKYLVNSVAPSVQATLSSAVSSASSQALNQAMDQMKSQLAQTLADQMGQAMQTQMAGFATSLKSAMSVDPTVFASAIKVNMDQEDLTSLLANYMNAEELSYDNNLAKLGYADETEPESINIYAKSFDDKQEVKNLIDAYNKDQEAAHKADRSISYSDLTGVLMGSVSDIIHMISLVLIAFVSVSLVVSSIMIGIITYISVLERKKEIGILRAMGASKLNIANIFNAETFIEGLFAGGLAIAIVLLVSVPVNIWVEKTYNVENILALPWTQAAILILISVILTLVAGVIPSTAAARRDPVEALRSE